MKHDLNVADYIEPLHINGMAGRMLSLPARGKQRREILVVYGHHSTLERWWGLVQNFNDFGSVTMPDLPGFGGMASFHSIGKQATLDNYADYLAAFLRLRYRRKKVTVVGISFGFLVVTRMLQRSPELSGKIEMLVSAMGFMHYDNFTFSTSRYRFYRYSAEVLSLPPLPFVFRYTGLTSWVLKRIYARTNNAKHKFKSAKDNHKLFNEMMDMEIQLWQRNDVRTYMQTSVEMLTVDNCDKQISLPVLHVFTLHDNYFDNETVEQQMRVVFSDVTPVLLPIKGHSPSVVASKKEAATFIPTTLKQALRRTSKKYPKA